MRKLAAEFLFCPLSGVVLLAWSNDGSDPQFQISRDAEALLSRTTDAKGRQLKVVRLPCPPVLHMTEEEAAGVEVKGVSYCSDGCAFQDCACESSARAPQHHCNQC